MCQLTQTMMNDRLTYVSDLQCTVLEVKVIDGLGTTIDVVLVNGTLQEGQTIVLCGLQGPIVTTIKALLTPPPLTELRVKSQYVPHKTVKAAMGVKIAASGLEHAIAGSHLLVAGKRDNIEELKDEVMGDLQTILSRIDKSGIGVCVQSSTLGSLEALLSFLEESKVKRIYQQILDYTLLTSR
jgi:translation initiation factor 5B